MIIKFNKVDLSSREKSVKEILLRNVKIEVDEEICEIEDFLVHQIGVPQTWLFEAKAAEALRWKDYRETVKYLIQAECFNTAHDVSMTSASE